MSKSNGRSMFGTSNRGQTVTVIEAPVRYSQRRKAKIGFWVTAVTVMILGGTVAAHYMHPILGGIVGLVLGVLLGGILAALIIIWPVLRILWHWLPEILLGTFLVYGWTWLMFATPVWASLLILGGILGAPTAYGRTRRLVMSVFWCVTVRHRLRMCFSAFISTNRQGTLPFILLARPTRAGERVWVWLRPGLSLFDLEQPGQLQKLAVACWADQARVTRDSGKYAALVRIDITRRDTLTGTVLSNLPDKVPADTPAVEPVSPEVVPDGLNLNEVTKPRRRRSPDDNSAPRPRAPRTPEPPSSDYDPSDYA